MKGIVYNGVEIHQYLINEHGSVFSLKTNKVIKQRTHEGGYKMITVWNPKQKELYIHRAVAFAYLANPLKKRYVNHLDGNKENNYFKNLEWSTAKENIDHAIKMGLANGCIRKLNLELAEEIRKKKPFMSVSKLAKEYGVSARTISFVVKNEHWKTANS